MKTTFKTIVALLASVATPAIVAAVISQSSDFGIIVLVIATIHLIILGIPAFLWGWATDAISLWSTLAVAFIVGATPSTFLLLIWPHYSYSPVNLFEDIRFVTVLGLFGSLGGLAFWLIWRYWIHTNSRLVHQS